MERRMHMPKRILVMLLCLILAAGLVMPAGALPVQKENGSVDRCCHTLRVNPLDVNYVRPAYDGYLIEVTPQRVADTFAYLDEHYVKNHPEQALDVYTGTEEDQENLLKLAEIITADCTTDKQKADAIDRWIYRNIYYDINTSAYAYDTFYNRIGNCLSYANLMQFLLRSLGIPAVVGDGWRGDMKTSTVELFNYEGHAWCFVYLQGEWVLYDPLWIACGTTDRDYIAEWIYLDTVEFVTPASDGDNLPPEAWDKPKVYYTDGRWYNFDNSHPTGYGNYTMMVNNQSYNFTPCQDELALGLDGGYDGWYILDGKNDKSGMQLGEIYCNSWLSYGEYEGGSYLNLTYAHPNGMQVDGAIMEYDGVERYMHCNTSFPVLAEKEDYTMQYGCLAFKPGYVGPFVAPCWGSLYDSDFYIVTWESETPEVCTVDENGILTAVAPGFAQVSLTLSDQEGGGYYCITHINVCVSDEERIPQLDFPTASGTCGENLTWELKNGTLTISGTGAMYDYEYMETPWWDYLEDIRQIVVQDGVTRIGKNAFREAVNVTNVALSDTITEIGPWTFMGAEKLTAVTLPGNLATLEQEAFRNCYALEEIELPGTLTFIETPFDGCTSLKRVVIGYSPDILSLVTTNSLFRGCTALEEIRVDEDHFALHAIDGALYVGYFRDLSLNQYPLGRKATDWVVAQGTRMIDQFAVENAQFLETVTIPACVEEIGNYAFRNCYKLTTIYFEGNAPALGEYVFEGVTATAYYPAGDATWTEAVMESFCGDITWLPYEANPKDPSGTCGDNLTWVLDQEGVLTISGTGGMWDDQGWGLYSDKIRKVVFGEGVTGIGSWTFHRCGNLTDVTIPESVVRIGEGAFYECSGLKSIVIPGSVTTLESSVFGDCLNLRTVTFEGDAPEMGDFLFMNVTATAYYPANNDTWTEDKLLDHAGSITWVPYEIPVTEIASGWSGATQWTLTDDGVLTVYGKGNMKNYGYNGGQPWLNKGVEIRKVVIEEGVTAVGTGAFRNLTTLKSVTLPESGLKTIGEAAFYGCSALKEITIPEGIYTIWSYTFKGCTALEKVNFPKTLIKVDQGAFENCTSLPYIYFPTNVEIIGSWSFKGCTGLIEADMTWTDATKIREGAFKNCSSLTTIHLPVNIQTLGDSCFYGIGATSFTVPDTVTSIEAWCFARAYSLKNIYFEGDAPTIGQGAFNKITLTARYPRDNATWTAEVMQNYGGTVTWKAN